MNIHSIADDGFYMSDSYSRFNNLAMLSFRTSLRCYFTTYNTVKSGLAKYIEEDDNNVETKDKYPIPYVENATLAITCFHHFVELVIKEILQSNHVLLALDANKQSVTLFDLLKGDDVDIADLEKTKQLEFSEALNRIEALLKAERIDVNKYNFIKVNAEALRKLNTLRNRIAHRGVFILRYAALDKLFGKYLLPFYLDVIKLEEFSSKELKYKKLNVEIDPIQKIVESFKEGYDPEKVALLKELGRASFNNPLFKFSPFDDETKNRAIKLANHVVDKEYASEPVDCPVCGLKTLVRFNDSVDETDEFGNTLNYFEYIYKVECFCCGFKFSNEVRDIDEFGLPIENFLKL